MMRVKVIYSCLALNSAWKISDHHTSASSLKEKLNKMCRIKQVCIWGENSLGVESVRALPLYSEKNALRAPYTCWARHSVNMPETWEYLNLCCVLWILSSRRYKTLVSEKNKKNKHDRASLSFYFLVACPAGLDDWRKTDRKTSG